MIRGFRHIIFFFIVAMLVSATALAAPTTHKVTSFSSDVVTEEGGELLRIEIGLSRPPADYVVKGDGVLHPKKLTIDLPNTEKGDLRPMIPLYGEFASSLTVTESARHTTRLEIAMAARAAARNYRVYTKEEDKAQKKPYRLVIDLLGDRPEPVPERQGIKGRTVVIDPGHGGSDSGAIGVGGLREKDVTLRVAHRLKQLLIASGVKVIMTRETDRDVYGKNASDGQELQARVNYGYRDGVDVFLSIHCNAFSNPAANGTEAYYYPKTSYDALLARKLQAGMLRHGKRRDRGVKEARWYVCRHSAVPASLVELAFITNSIEGRLLADPDFQQEMAEGLSEGLSDYFVTIGRGRREGVP